MASIGSDPLRQRCGLIVRLAKSVQDLDSQFGKTSLQKLVYFLQEWKRVPCGYRFEFYNYGPYCQELMGDLDHVSALGGVEVTSVASGYGYKIRPGRNADTSLEAASHFLREHAAMIDSVVTEFGKMSASELELRATLHFVYRDMARSGDKVALDELVERVREVKPRFKTDQVCRAETDMQQKGILAAAS